MSPRESPQPTRLRTAASWLLSWMSHYTKSRTLAFEAEILWPSEAVQRENEGIRDLNGPKERKEDLRSADRDLRDYPSRTLVSHTDVSLTPRPPPHPPGGEGGGGEGARP